MIIEINQRWHISSNRQQWKLERRREVSGEIRWDPKSFHKTLDSAIVWLGKKRIYPSHDVGNVQMLEDLIRKVEPIVNEANQVLSNHHDWEPCDMAINVSADWRISGDDLQWTVQRWSGKKWSSLSYHRRLNNAVQAMLGTRIRLLEGQYGPEVLATVCRALDSLKRNDTTADIGEKTRAVM